MATLCIIAVENSFGQNTMPALALEDCRISAGRGFPSMKARCGTFERYENPDDSSSPILELYVAVIPALSLEPEPDPLVPIAGGPGAASTVFYASYASAFEKIRRNRDIVLIDQRGTGQSAPLVCDIDEDVIEGRFSTEDTVAFTEDCLAALPNDPRFFTTSVAVSDLEALRIALGYTTFNLYGVSYGTRVAQHYLRQHPESIRTVILDGVVAPQVPLGPAIAIDAQNTLNFIFDRCAENAQCAERFPTLREDFIRITTELEAELVGVTVPDPLTGKTESLEFGNEELAIAMRLLSYHPSSVAMMPLLIDEAANGNFAPLAAQALMISTNLSDAINLGMHNAVMCTEDAPYYAMTEGDRTLLSETYIGPMQLEALETICSIWPAGVIDEGFHEPVVTDVPVLLLSGEADPVTPPAYAELAAINMRNALHLEGTRQGHGLAIRGCTPAIMGEFVESASVEGLQSDCLQRLHAMPFFLDFSGPSP